MTTYVDADTKILILPLPESKRKVKIQDTKYDNVQTYGDLFARDEKVQTELEAKQEKVVRFEDKTQEEIS